MDNTQYHFNTVSDDLTSCTRCGLVDLTSEFYSEPDNGVYLCLTCANVVTCGLCEAEAHFKLMREVEVDCEHVGYICRTVCV
jgi:hypothetical protein